MKNFILNEFLELKLENQKTNIYVDGELFMQCKKLILNIYPWNEEFDKIKSIDAAALVNDKFSQENGSTTNHLLSPEEEFKGHCSNLQVWVENDYNTNLLHSNLAFPLLKRLTEVGDQQARRVFKDEVFKRFSTGEETAIVSLIESDYLSRDENEYLLEDPKITQNLLTVFKSENFHYRNTILNFVKKLGNSHNFIIRNFSEIAVNFSTRELSTLLNYLRVDLNFQEYNTFLENNLISFLIKKYKDLSSANLDGINLLLDVIGEKNFPNIKFEERRIDYGLFNYEVKEFYKRKNINFGLKEDPNGNLAFRIRPFNKLYSYELHFMLGRWITSKEELQLLYNIKNALFGNEEIIIKKIKLNVFIHQEYDEDDDFYDEEFKNKNEIQIFVLKLNHDLNVEKFEKNIELLLQTSMEMSEKIIILYKIVRNYYLSKIRDTETRIIEKDLFFYKLVDYYKKHGYDVILEFNYLRIFKIREKNKNFYIYFNNSEMLIEIKKIFFSSETDLLIQRIHHNNNNIFITVNFDS